MATITDFNKLVPRTFYRMTVGYGYYGMACDGDGKCSQKSIRDSFGIEGEITILFLALIHEQFNCSKLVFFDLNKNMFVCMPDFAMNQCYDVKFEEV